MIVKCTKNIDILTQEEIGDCNPWLKIGAVYSVLEIFIGHDASAPKYRICSGVDGKPGLFSATLFEIVDGTMPTNWAINYVANKYMEAGPSPWQKGGFWEAFFNDEAWAVSVYNTEIEKMGVLIPPGH